MNNISRYNEDLAQQRMFADQDFKKLIEEKQEKEAKEISKKGDLEAALAPFGVAGIQNAGSRIAGNVLRKFGLNDTADIAEDIINNPSKGISKLYEKGTKALSDKLSTSSQELKDRITKMGEDQITKMGEGGNISGDSGESGIELEDLSGDLPETKVPQISETSFSEGGELSQIVDDMSTGKISTVEGVIKSQNISSLNVSPKISDLQANLGLRPAQVPNQMSDGEVQGLTSKANKLKPQVGDESNLVKAQVGPQENIESSVVDTQTEQAQANIKAAGEASEAAGEESAEGGLSSGVEAGLESGLVENAADLENPVGDVLEVALGAALLFGSIFGSKVDHNAPPPPIPTNPTVGFGIKSD